ncbi:MAG: hypothetical protein B7X94_00225 [Hydrogenophilales bacterium 17-62-8]|nr:MAG: hypothetical protein B7X94_00225 [Hydrogenophilales bacterium 17-62-8]
MPAVSPKKIKSCFCEKLASSNIRLNKDIAIRFLFVEMSGAKVRPLSIRQIEIIRFTSTQTPLIAGTVRGGHVW